MSTFDCPTVGRHKCSIGMAPLEMQMGQRNLGAWVNNKSASIGALKDARTRLTQGKVRHMYRADQDARSPIRRGYFKRRNTPSRPRAGRQQTKR